MHNSVYVKNIRS